MAGNEVRLVPLNEEGKENLEVVEKLLKEKEVNCCWVVRGDVLNQVKSDDVIYVVDPAHGDEVGHLVENGLTVIGAQCAVTVLKHNIQLNNNLKYPVYNLTMMGMLVSLSNFQPSDRSHLISLVERMGGRVSGELTGNVSHLVVKEVGSVKYFSACHAKIPVMRAEWLEYLWKQEDIQVGG
uniref:DNA topoisomerase 2-binding protein 1-like n=1 Tax=Ciona intestinalis TaxID=7719 RepID=UPI00089DBC7C|nr:DNA topoisomerase 2-binding protein 1-like [Ciona intestinalis]|eukprot:XP_004227551.2 DNA topoisomerase 2-binding protein 1-like [Ciona intestinalis]